MAVPSRHATEARYAGYRAIALRRAEALLVPVTDVAPVSLRTITPAALAAFETAWRACPERVCAWPWREMAGDYRHHEPTRFEAAIWSGSILCGLALGRVRAGYCSVDYLEGCPVPAHPLRGKVLSVMLTALTTYAVALDKREIRLVEPVDALVPRYRALGFVLAHPKGEARYCFRTVP